MNLGASDGFTLWLNHERIFYNTDTRPADFTASRKVQLRAGQNRLLLKMVTRTRPPTFNFWTQGTRQPGELDSLGDVRAQLAWLNRRADTLLDELTTELQQQIDKAAADVTRSWSTHHRVDVGNQIAQLGRTQRRNGSKNFFRNDLRMVADLMHGWAFVKEARPDADSAFVKDLGNIGRILERMDPERERDDLEAELKSLETAWRHLHAFHRAKVLHRDAHEAVSQTRWRQQNVDRVLLDPDEWRHQLDRVLALSRDLRALEWADDAQTRLRNLPESAAAKAITTELSHRRESRAIQAILTAERHEIAGQLAQVVELLAPRAEMHRTALANMAPDIPSQLRELARKVEAAENAARDLVDSADGQLTSANNLFPLIRAQDEIRRDVWKLGGALRQDANSRDLLSESGREASRDNDDAAARISELTRKALALMLEVRDHSEIRGQIEAIESGADENRNLVADLELMALHFQRLANGKSVERTRAVLRSHEEPLGILEQKEREYGLLEEASRLAQAHTAEAVVATLKPKAETDESIQREVSLIARDQLEQALRHLRVARGELAQAREDAARAALARGEVIGPLRKEFDALQESWRNLVNDLPAPPDQHEPASDQARDLVAQLRSQAKDLAGLLPNLEAPAQAASTRRANFEQAEALRNNRQRALLLGLKSLAEIELPFLREATIESGLPEIQDMQAQVEEAVSAARNSEESPHDLTRFESNAASIINRLKTSVESLRKLERIARAAAEKETPTEIEGLSQKLAVLKKETGEWVADFPNAPEGLPETHRALQHAREIAERAEQQCPSATSSPKQLSGQLMAVAEIVRDASTGLGVVRDRFVEDHRDRAKQQAPANPETIARLEACQQQLADLVQRFDGIEADVARAKVPHASRALAQAKKDLQFVWQDAPVANASIEQLQDTYDRQSPGMETANKTLQRATTAMRDHARLPYYRLTEQVRDQDKHIQKIDQLKRDQDAVVRELTSRIRQNKSLLGRQRNGLTEEQKAKLEKQIADDEPNLIAARNKVSTLNYEIAALRKPLEQTRLAARESQKIADAAIRSVDLARRDGSSIHSDMRRVQSELRKQLDEARPEEGSPEFAVSEAADASGQAGEVLAARIEQLAAQVDPAAFSVSPVAEAMRRSGQAAEVGNELVRLAKELAAAPTNSQEEVEAIFAEDGKHRDRLARSEDMRHRLESLANQLENKGNNAPKTRAAMPLKEHAQAAREALRAASRQTLLIDPELAEEIAEALELTDESNSEEQIDELTREVGELLSQQTGEPTSESSPTETTAREQQISRSLARALAEAATQTSDGSEYQAAESSTSEVSAESAETRQAEASESTTSEAAANDHSEATRPAQTPASSEAVAASRSEAGEAASSSSLNESSQSASPSSESASNTEATEASSASSSASASSQSANQSSEGAGQGQGEGAGQGQGEGAGQGQGEGAGQGQGEGAGQGQGEGAGQGQGEGVGQGQGEGAGQGQGEGAGQGQGEGAGQGQGEGAGQGQGEGAGQGQGEGAGQGQGEGAGQGQGEGAGQGQGEGAGQGQGEGAGQGQGEGAGQGQGEGAGQGQGQGTPTEPSEGSGGTGGETLTAALAEAVEHSAEQIKSARAQPYYDEPQDSAGSPFQVDNQESRKLARLKFMKREGWSFLDEREVQTEVPVPRDKVPEAFQDDVEAYFRALREMRGAK